MVGESDANRTVPTNGPAIMLEPDQWDSVLSRARGTIYRNIERISSNALLNLLEVGPDPITRQRMGKSRVRRAPLCRSRTDRECDTLQHSDSGLTALSLRPTRES